VVEKASTDEVYAACALKLRSAIASLIHHGFFLTVVLRLRPSLDPRFPHPAVNTPLVPQHSSEGNFAGSQFQVSTAKSL
jgi:hypothetical protein